MPKALFFNVPAHGHINPSLPLVAELVRRGHQVIYFTTEGYRAQVEATGAVFRGYQGIRDDFFDARGLSGKVPMRVVYELMIAAEQLVPELLDAARAEQPDYILHDGACAWGLMIARILRLPSVTSLSLMPTTPPSRAMLMNREALRFFGSLFKEIGKGLEANRRAQKLSQQYSIPKLGMGNILNAYGNLCLSYSSSYFVPNADKSRAPIRYLGWTPTMSASGGEVDFERIQGRKLIYVSLGTINNDAADFFRACIDAFKGSNYFVVMSTGKRVAPETFGALPENIAIYSWVPQAQVLERADLFITHGGMNSVHDGLYYGLPLLVVPQQAEQTLIGLRVAELDGGLLLNSAGMNAGTIRGSADRLLTEARFKTGARKIAESLRTRGGLAKAVDEIEAVVGEQATT